MCRFSTTLFLATNTRLIFSKLSYRLDGGSVHENPVTTQPQIGHHNLRDLLRCHFVRWNRVVQLELSGQAGDESIT
jgi:hypothetical protein